MKRIIVFAFALAVILTGCGSSTPTAGGDPKQTATNLVMKSGQWSFGMSTGNAGNDILESAVNVNLVVEGNTVTATDCLFVNYAIYYSSSATHLPCTGEVQVTDGVLSGTFIINGYGTYTFAQGTLNTTGNNVSHGTFSGVAPLASEDVGVVSGDWYPPFSGSYSGTISGFGMADNINVTVNQNNYNLQINGSDSGNGVVATIAFPSNNVVGGVSSGTGTWFTPLSPEPYAISVFAIANQPTESSLQVFVYNTYGELEQGLLTKR